MAEPMHEISDVPDPDFAQTALFLDFDGVLVDIAATPDAVQVAPGLTPILAALHDRLAGGVTLLSGRAITALEGFLADFPGDAIGGHGAERRIGGDYERHAFADDPRLAQLREDLRAWVADRPGLLLEEKPTGLVLHYRAAPDRAAEVRAHLTDLLAGQDDLNLHASKMVEEIRPADANKGDALERALADRPAMKAIMFGDDTTDEPAMQAAIARGGFAVKVGDGPTQAAYRLADPLAVHALLRRWAGLI